MSDLLTHWAVHEDCRRLCAHDEQVDPELLAIIGRNPDLARLGAVSRGGSKFVPKLLRKGEPEHRVAFALGGILHFPADYVLKPLMSELAQAEWNREHHQMQAGSAGKASIREISAYYDVHVFRKVFLNGSDGPFAPEFLNGNASASGKQLEAFVGSLFQRALLRCHTLSPDLSNPGPWVDRLSELLQPLYLNVAQYAQVYASPDPAKQEAYAVETRFYKDTDPAIMRARALQRGDTNPPEALGPNQSGYGRALEIGVEKMREASRFWRGETETPPDVSQG